MFSCKKCNQPLYVKGANLKDKILTLDARCINGHKSKRRIAEHQIEEMSSEIFSRMYTCLDCGLQMTQLNTEIHGQHAESIFLCPIHGPKKREFPASFLAAVSLSGVEVDTTEAILKSFRCPQCHQVYAISEIEKRGGVLELHTRCPNNHRSVRYISDKLEPDIKKKLLQRHSPD